jgi:WD40 repeat protein
VNTGNGLPTPLTTFEEAAEWLAVSPDGRIVAVVTTDLNNRQKIVLRNLETTTDEVIAENGEYAALRWLADGSALSWSGPDRSAGSAGSGVWLWSKAQRTPVRVAEDGFGPVWSNDNRTVYYSKIGEINGLWQKRQREELVRSWPDNVVYFDVSGEKIVFSQANEIVRTQIHTVDLVR